jgi:hypothetical protein
VAKLKSIGRSLEATIWKPSYPPSSKLRLTRDRDLLQINFLPGAQPARVRRVTIGGHDLLVQFFAGSLRREEPPPQPKRRNTADESEVSPARPKRLEALKAASAEDRRDQIRRLLALPPDRRTHFLRKRIGIQASCL